MTESATPSLRTTTTPTPTPTTPAGSASPSGTNAPPATGGASTPATGGSSATTSKSLVNDLIEAGIHFGQRSSGWNPKMGRFIYGKRSGIHIIDIRETVKGLLRAKKFIAQVVASGKDVCFVGTKRQSRDILKQRVGDIKMHWVTERWLGGTLTNFRTIRSRLKRLEELERLHESGEIETYSKKMESQLRREREKITRNLEGIRNMSSLPGVIIAIDVSREKNALMEARKLGIPTICLIDTDGDPDLVDLPIPGNDDSMRSIDVIVREMCAAVIEGKSQRVIVSRDRDGGVGGASTGGDRARDDAEAGGGAPSAAPRRSRRARYRADDSSAPSAGGGGDDVLGSSSGEGSTTAKSAPGKSAPKESVATGDSKES
jgi:small subunit ribosomal protein S2